MKLLVLNYEYPPLGGGAGFISQNIAEKIAGLGHKVTVVTTWYKTEKETEQKGNLTIIRLKSKRKHIYKSSVSEMLSWIRECRKFLLNYCKTENFDHCFANFSMPGGSVALTLKRIFGLQYSIISHGHDIPWRYPEQMRLFHIAAYYKIRKICRESEINFVQTKEMKDNIDRFLGKASSKKNILIPNGVDTTLFTPNYSARSEKFKILFVGRLVEQKDPFTFLKAIQLFTRNNQNFVIHVVGDGILRSGMEKFVAENKLSDTVKFLGWVSKAEIVHEYQSSHVKIITSVFEGMSVAALEALACGCFLISTPIDGIIDTIVPEQNGVIVNFTSADEIEKQLNIFYNEKYLKGYKVSDAIIKQLNTTYDWNIIVKSYEKVFQKILS